MTLNDLIADGWRQHADEPQRVHDELAEAIGLVADNGALACRAAGRAAEFERLRALCRGCFDELSPEERASSEDELAELGVA